MNNVHVFSLTLKLEVSNYTTERLGWDNTLCTMGDREVVLCHLFDQFEFDNGSCCPPIVQTLFVGGKDRCI